VGKILVQREHIVVMKVVGHVPKEGKAVVVPNVVPMITNVHPICVAPVHPMSNQDFVKMVDVYFPKQRTPATTHIPIKHNQSAIYTPPHGGDCLSKTAQVAKRELQTHDTKNENKVKLPLLFDIY
jgi:hypothetical protein